MGSEKGLLFFFFKMREIATCRYAEKRDPENRKTFKVRLMNRRREIPVHRNGNDL